MAVTSRFTVKQQSKQIPYTQKRVNTVIREARGQRASLTVKLHS